MLQSLNDPSSAAAVAQPVRVSVDNPVTAVSVSNFPAGFAVAGTVAISNFPATQPVSGTVAVSNWPATTTVAGTVAVSNFPATQAVSGTVTVANPTAAATLNPVVDRVYLADGSWVPVKRALLDLSLTLSLGNLLSAAQPLVPAVAGKRLLVVGLSLSSLAAVGLRLLSGTTAISARRYLAAGGSQVLPFCRHGWFTTAAGAALQLDASSAVAVTVAAGVDVLYVEVP